LVEAGGAEESDKNEKECLEEKKEGKKENEKTR
jgi:hypothetical protein